jgi:hypothetical protein
MRQFQVMNLQGHIPATDFYRSLEQMTDNTGLNDDIPVSDILCDSKGY